jgi:EmrB/QacA subfamily drug resistance transporter
MVLAAIDGTIVNTALPTIAGDLGGLAQLPWVATFYLLTSTVTVPIYGKLSDIYGRKRLFQAAIVIFLVGSVLAGFAQSMVQLILFRGLQGIGGGGLISMAMVILGAVTSPRERGRYIGYLMPIFFVTSVLGPPLGGLIVDRLSWRWIFFVNVPFGTLALIVTSRVLRQVPFTSVRRRVDVEGAALLVAAVSSLLLVMSWGGRTYAWNSMTIRALATFGVVLVSGFIAWEIRSPEPIMPLRLFRTRAFGIVPALAFMLGCSLFGATLFMPLYFQVVRGSTASASGIRTLAMVVPMMSMVTITGRLISRTGRYKVFCVTGLGCALVGMVLLARSVAPAGSATFVALPILGVGLGLVLPVLTLAAQNAVGHEDLGVATSAVTFFQSLGGAFGLAAFGAVLTARFDQAIGAMTSVGSANVDAATLARGPQQMRLLPPETVHIVVAAMDRALHAVFLVAAAVLAVAFVVSWLLQEVPLREEVHAEPPIGGIYR